MAKRHIRKFTGELTADNFDRVNKVIDADDFIGLDVLIDCALFDQTV